MKKNSRIILWIIIIALLIVFSYRLYAPTLIEEFNALNLKNINAVKRNLEDNNNYSFIVVGNIKNSISVFDKNIFKKIKKENPDFIISTGNNVLEGGEGKYRVLYRTLQQLNIPFITGVGENEVIESGYKNYYKYFGPFYYSFHNNKSLYIFLDTTGHTPMAWQKEWLEEKLNNSHEYKHVFVFMNKPPIKVKADYIIDENERYIADEKNRKYFQDLFAKKNIDGVFSGNMQLYYKKEIQGVDYFITGGAGGELLLEDKNSYYHYLKVNITNSGVSYEKVKVENTFTLLNSNLAKFMGNLWVSLQSFLYTNYIDILLITLLLLLIGFIIYLEINREVNYYRNFAYLLEKNPDKEFNIAMFTNNYFPNVGGVPISIYRLAEGLESLGHQVFIFAPQYPNREKFKEGTKNVIRCKNLYHHHKNGMDMPISNIFSPAIKKKFKELDIDLVHTHHPFWLGKKGQKLAQKNNIPVVYTYHTRLEKYAHYLPDFLFIEQFFKKRISHFMIRRYSNNCDAIFAPTGTAREYLRNVGVSKFIKVLPTGIELDNYKADKFLNKLKSKYKKDDNKVLFSVSRLSREKNLYFLLKGIKYIKNNTNFNFQFLLAGDGGEKENIQEYIIKNDLEDYIKLLGLVENDKLCRYYMLADIFVFASKSETQGMVLLEAMAGRTPVVAVRSSGIEDIIDNGYNGYKTREDIEEWGNKIIELMQDENKLNQMGENAHKLASDHSIIEMAKKASEIYNKVVYLNQGKN